jgi:ankyrin repeat protein
MNFANFAGDLGNALENFGVKLDKKPAQHRPGEEPVLADSDDEASRDSAEEDDEDKLTAPAEDPTRLFALLKRKKWGKAAECALADVEEAETWIVKENSDGSVRWQLLPLHHACENEAPANLVRALLEAYPEAASCKDSGGDLPIHLACREKASPEVILMLLQSDADTTRVADAEGRLPLHLAVRRGASVDVVEKLIAANIKASKKVDSHNMLPLHWACSQNASVQVIHALLRANPYANSHEDNWKRTGVSLTESSTNPERDIILAALERPPHYWTQSLLSEVDKLRTKVKTGRGDEEKLQKKASTLESRLNEVIADSSANAENFQEVKDKLEKENSGLKKTVEENESTIEKLRAENAASVEKLRAEHAASIEKLRAENAASVAENKALAANLRAENAASVAENKALAGKLESLTNILMSMENQRHKLLRNTGKWEESLEKSTAILKLVQNE